MRLERLQAEYERAVAILEARVRTAYMDEPPDMLSFLVSASSFDDSSTTSTFSNASAGRTSASPPRWRERSGTPLQSGPRRSNEALASGDRLGDRRAH